MVNMPLAERQQQAETLVQEHVGVAITPDTPREIIDDGLTSVTTRYMFPKVTVDVRLGTVDMTYTVIMWSPTIREPLAAYKTAVDGEGSGWLHAVIVSPSGRTLGIQHFCDGVKEDVWVEKTPLYVRTEHYRQGVLHRTDGLATHTVMPSGATSDKGNWYCIHGEHVKPTATIRKAIDTQDTALLTRMVGYKNPAVAYFAAHNPYCPETAVTEYALTRGGDYSQS